MREDRTDEPHDDPNHRVDELAEMRPLPPIEEDPFFKLCGSVASDPDDSRTIDEVVYGLVDRNYP